MNHLNMNKEKLVQIFLVVLGILVLANLIFLDIKVFKEERKEIAKVLVSYPSPTPILVLSPPPPLKEKILSCPLSCLEKIYEATSSLTLPTPKTIVQKTPQSSVKEFYIPLGSGSTSSTAWEEIKNAEAYFNPQNYGEIKSITFEALMHIPTANGRVYARLYNVNDKVGLVETEIWAEGSAGVRIESPPFHLPSGRKLYRVQLKSTLGYEAILDLARLKVVVK